MENMPFLDSCTELPTWCPLGFLTGTSNTRSPKPGHHTPAPHLLPIIDGGPTFPVVWTHPWFHTPHLVYQPILVALLAKHIQDISNPHCSSAPTLFSPTSSLTSIPDKLFRWLPCILLCLSPHGLCSQYNNPSEPFKT